MQYQKLAAEKEDHLWPCLPAEEKKMVRSWRNLESIKKKKNA